MTAIIELPEAIERYVSPGAHLHFASLPFRSNAAVVEIARQFRQAGPTFTLSATGFHSTLHLLARLNLGSRYIASYFGDNFPVPRANRLYDGLPLEIWSLASLVEAFRAGALGLPAGMVRSLVGSDLGTDLERAGRVKLTSIDDVEVALVAPMTPDVCFVHALAADRNGRLVFGRPWCEGAWSALASKRVVATVEEIVEPHELESLREFQPIPAHRVDAICVAPFGASPQPLPSIPDSRFEGYPDDLDAYIAWRERVADEAAFERWCASVLDAPDPIAARIRWRDQGRDATPERQVTTPVPERISTAPPALPRGSRDTTSTLAPVTLGPSGVMAGLAARTVHQLAADHDVEVVLAGIGRSFLASRMAARLAAQHGRQLRLMVEIGMYGLDSGTRTHPFLLASENFASSERLSDVEDVLGALTCGARNGAIGVLGAAEIDPSGAINSVRLPSGRFLVGSGGANDIASRADHVVVLTRCTPNRMVERVHHRTSPGHAVSFIVTDLGVFRRIPDGWELSALYPILGGANVSETVDIVRSRCVWDFEVPDDLAFTSVLSTRERSMLYQLDPSDRTHR